MAAELERLAVVETRIDHVDVAVERLDGKVSGLIDAVAKLRGGMLALGSLWTLIVSAAVLFRSLWR